MLKRLGRKKKAFNPEEQCPNCNSRQVIPSGEMLGNQQPMYCQSCRAIWSVVKRTTGIVFEGLMIPFDETHDRSPGGDTRDLFWYEIRMSTRQPMFCPSCRDWYKALYTIAASPEEAVRDENALCWVCSTIEDYFPRNMQINVPTVYK